MTRVRSLIIFVVLGALFLTPVAAMAQTTAQERNSLISSHCQELNYSLTQLERRDLVARTNRGRAYEDFDNQMTALSQRLANNKIDSKQFDDLLTQLRTTTDQFRNDYVTYDNGIQALIQLDCHTKPDAFATQLEQVRIWRQSVADDITHGDAILAQYRQAVVTLQTQLQQLNTQASGAAQ